MSLNPCLKVTLATATLFLTLSCKQSSDNHSAVKSDWESAAVPDQARAYIVDWSCEPKQFGRSAEVTVWHQEEYCEWKTVKTTATDRVCRFTSSFDRSRDFYLNSRRQTQFNTVEAARYLVDSCAADATSRLKKNAGTGKLCTNLSDACVAERNSDPEICDKIRWATKERFEKRIEFCVDQLPSQVNTISDKPFMQFGLLTALPENCEYATEDHTEVVCTIPKDEECFSVAGQLRVGLRVFTKEVGSNAELPAAESCDRVDVPDEILEEKPADRPVVSE